MRYALSFDAGPESSHRVTLVRVRESTPGALALGVAEIEPAIVARQPVELDFTGIELCSQSWLHALLYGSIRLAWARRVPIHIVNAAPAVRDGLRFLQSYALGG